MIDRCTFTNCGSADRPALDYGYTDINMFTNSTITGTKQIKYGFLGSLAEMSNVTIHVNATKAAMALRHPRATKGSRTPATIIHSVTCNGKMILADGFPQGDGGPSNNPIDDHAYTEPMSEGQSNQGWNHSGPKWWVPGQYDYPFPRLFYNCTINGASYDYVLTSGAGNARDLKSGMQIDLSGVERVGVFAGGSPIMPQGAKHAIVNPNHEVAVYGLDGRLIGRHNNRQSLHAAMKNGAANGVFITRSKTLVNKVVKTR
jgi:hypothetical protein